MIANQIMISPMLSISDSDMSIAIHGASRVVFEPINEAVWHNKRLGIRLNFAVQHANSIRVLEHARNGNGLVERWTPKLSHDRLLWLAGKQTNAARCCELVRAAMFLVNLQVNHGIACFRQLAKNPHRFSILLSLGMAL